MDRDDQSDLDAACMKVKLAFKKLLEGQAISHETNARLTRKA